jgi:hypothetical protein
MPTAVFFTWICVMTYMILKAISAEERRLAPAEPVGPQTVRG